MNTLLDAPTVNFCEKAGTGIIKRPYYAVTNLAYLLVSAVIFFKNPKSKLAQLFAVTSLLIGILSFNYDALYVRWAQLLDLGGMLLFVSLLLYLNFAEIWRTKRRFVAVFLFGIFTISELLIFMIGAYSGNIIFGLLVVAYILSEGYFHHLKKHKNYHYWYWAFALFALGFSIWLTDPTGLVCFKIGLFNGRAIFHYLTALSIYFLYTFYASQEVSTKIE
jgi:hypothetical protein